jgi:hypothetical protein
MIPARSTMSVPCPYSFKIVNKILLIANPIKKKENTNNYNITSHFLIPQSFIFN